MIFHNSNIKMTKEYLYYKLTGVKFSKSVTERENIIIDKCLEIINDRELELYERNSEHNMLEKKYNALIEINKINNKINENLIFTEKKKYKKQIIFDDSKDENYSGIIANHLNSED